MIVNPRLILDLAYAESDQLKVDFTAEQKSIAQTGDLELNKLYGSKFSPSISCKNIIYKYILRLNYSHNYRSPTIKELYYDFDEHSPSVYGNPNLKPQTSDYFSLSYIDLVT